MYIKNEVEQRCKDGSNINSTVTKYSVLFFINYVLLIV